MREALQVVRIIAKTKEGSTAEDAFCSVGRHTSTRVGQGRKN